MTGAEAERERIDPHVVDVPELYAALKAHNRSRAVDAVRSEAAAELALAVYDAAQIATATLIAQVLGISRPRVVALTNQGRKLALQRQKGAQ